MMRENENEQKKKKIKKSLENWVKVANGHNNADWRILTYRWMTLMNLLGCNILFSDENCF